MQPENVIGVENAPDLNEREALIEQAFCAIMKLSDLNKKAIIEKYFK